MPSAPRSSRSSSDRGMGIMRTRFPSAMKPSQTRPPFKTCARARVWVRGNHYEEAWGEGVSMLR